MGWFLPTPLKTGQPQCTLEQTVISLLQKSLNALELQKERLIRRQVYPLDAIEQALYM